MSNMGTYFQPKAKAGSMKMRCLKNAMGVTRRERIRNEVMRERVHSEPVVNCIQRQQIKWFGDLERIPL